MQKHLSAVSQMVAKMVATRADYEVTRQAINRKNPAEDTDWDRKVDALRCVHELAIGCICARSFLVCTAISAVPTCARSAECGRNR